MDDLNYYNSFLDFIYSKLETCNDNSKKLLSLNYNKDTNLGLHAGILGILAVTNKLLKKNRLKEKATLIQNEILDMIINKLEESDFKYYPALYKENKPCRLCWTYGELILALQLLAAGKLTANENVERYATDLAEVASTRTTLDEAMVYDSCIISGTVRNYLLYKLFNKYSHSKKIENLEFLWRDYTHIILFENKYHNINRYTLKPQIDLSILSGLSGIYISMSDFDYLWSEYILLDIF